MQFFYGGTEDLNYQVNAHLITCGSEEPLIYLYISTLRSITYLIILYLYLQLFISTYVPISTIFYESNSTDRLSQHNTISWYLVWLLILKKEILLLLLVSVLVNLINIMVKEISYCLAIGYSLLTNILF